MAHDLDRPLTLRAAAIASLVTAAPIAVLRVGLGRAEWLVDVSLLCFLAGFTTSGAFVGQRAPRVPMIHAAAGGFLGFATLAAVGIGRALIAGDGLDAASLIFLAVFAGIAPSLAMLGALLTWRRRKDIEPGEIRT